MDLLILRAVYNIALSPSSELDLKLKFAGFDTNRKPGRDRNIEISRCGGAVCNE